MSFVPFEVYIKYNVEELKAYYDALQSETQLIGLFIAKIEDKPKEETFYSISLFPKEHIRVNRLAGIKCLRNSIGVCLKEARDITDKACEIGSAIYIFPVEQTIESIVNSGITECFNYSICD